MKMISTSVAMARKLGPNRIDRLLGSYAYGFDRSSGGNDLTELGEEDIWSVEGSDSDEPTHRIRISSESNENNWDFAGRPTRAREDREIGGLSLAFNDASNAASPRIVHQFRGRERKSASSACGSTRGAAASAPVSVPSWPNILRVDSIESIQDGYESADDDEVDRVPPHEYLARSRKSAATSAFEGVGRTLKGRDMSRVRDAVWSRTGFFG